MTKIRRRTRITLFALVMLLATTTVPAQSSTPSGNVMIETKSIAAGIGMSWGNGKLFFNGGEYRFSIDGMTFIDFGISKTTAAGEVYNFTELTQFEGTYVAAEADFALGGGMGGIVLRNQNGVAIYLRTVSQGARLQLGTSGMKIKFWSHQY
jgi:hypothetical protein